MTASGAFAQGPSAAEKGPSTRGRVFGASVMKDWAPASTSDSGSGPRKPTTTANLVDSDPEDYDDNEQDAQGRKLETVDLFDIGREGEMAPLVLPRDEKKWAEEEQLREENQLAMRKLQLKKRGKHEVIEDDPPLPKVKQDPEEEEAMIAESLRATPASTSNGPGSRAESISSALASVKPEDGDQTAGMQVDAPAEDAAVLGAEDVKIKVKKEDVSQYFNLPDEQTKSDRFYVFQFPRLFPQFFDPEVGPPGLAPVVKKENEDGEEDVKPNVKAMTEGGENGADPVSAKHKVRSAYHESESEAWRDYEPGKWQGWGRNPGRETRENLAGYGADELSGRIGKLKIRKSGRTTMKLGGIEYDVSLSKPDQPE